MKNPQATLSAIIHAIRQRSAIRERTQVYRLFNGFYEGVPGLVLDRYGPALVVFNHTESGIVEGLIHDIAGWVTDHLDGVDAVLLKRRQDPDRAARNGILVAGDSLPKSITEDGVHYALDLRINQDVSFYPDTRELRRWLRANSMGKRVLNTFAYTGSLGVAAGVGGAEQVVQTDINAAFLSIAGKSWQLNDLRKDRHEIVEGDFFRVTARQRHAESLFDVVILDPPFFPTRTRAGWICKGGRIG